MLVSVFFSSDMAYSADMAHAGFFDSVSVSMWRALRGCFIGHNQAVVRGVTCGHERRPAWTTWRRGEPPSALLTWAARAASGSAATWRRAGWTTNAGVTLRHYLNGGRRGIGGSMARAAARNIAEPVNIDDVRGRTGVWTARRVLAAGRRTTARRQTAKGGGRHAATRRPGGETTAWATCARRLLQMPLRSDILFTSAKLALYRLSPLSTAHGAAVAPMAREGGGSVRERIRGRGGRRQTRRGSAGAPPAGCSGCSYHAACGSYATPLATVCFSVLYSLFCLFSSLRGAEDGREKRCFCVLFSLFISCVKMFCSLTSPTPRLILCHILDALC